MGTTSVTTDTIAYGPFPAADLSLLVDDTVEVPVQVNGKVRARITVPVGADAGERKPGAGRAGGGAARGGAEK